MFSDTPLVILSILLLAETLRSHFQLLRAIAPFNHPLSRAVYPSITVVRPIKGLDPGAEQNIQAALDHGYPGEVETIFVFDDEHEPALPLVRAAIDQRRKAGEGAPLRIIFAGSPPTGRTGKLHAMIAGLAQARGELVAFADSDIRPPSTALTRLVDTLLSTADAGSAFAPVVVTSRPKTAGDVGYSLLLNGLYGPAASESTNRNGGSLPFIMGQFMVFRREVLQRIGGLESAEGQLVDDMYLGARIAAAGYRNLVSPESVPIIQENLSLAEFVSIYRRWITFSRSGLPGLSFKLSSWLRGMVYWTGLVGGAGALLAGNPLAAAWMLSVPLAVSLSISLLHRTIGGFRIPLRYFSVPFLVLLVAPAILLSIYLKREVRWRGRSYQLNSQSRLSSGTPLKADERLPS